MVEIRDKSGKVVAIGENLWRVSQHDGIDKAIREAVREKIRQSGKHEEDVSMKDYENIFHECIVAAGYDVEFLPDVDRRPPDEQQEHKKA